ncbi:hypothetical protein T440DRAFT_465528 [Plenodomus tracheiphilus IPT5]|uniref:Uncharacterized protein n=1 Tax=Plenodomus tracheiphilus IPT5 TaxID=1408161 RepID=A0A6A7BGD6_9PLEO|nr:hypothetical protein T440DRAFT_465528 [Plenodomus tracheiphilus IPT5]
MPRDRHKNRSPSPPRNPNETPRPGYHPKDYRSVSPLRLRYRYPIMSTPRRPNSKQYIIPTALPEPRIDGKPSWPEVWRRQGRR